MSVEIAWKQNILVTDSYLLKLLLVVFGFGLQAFVCDFSRQNICSVYLCLLYWIYLICMSRSLLITQCRFLQSLLYHSLCSFRNVIAHRICWVGTATLAAMASQPPRGGCSGGSDGDGEGSGADSDGADSGGAGGTPNGARRRSEPVSSGPFLTSWFSLYSNDVNWLTLHWHWLKSLSSSILPLVSSQLGLHRLAQRNFPKKFSR